MSISDKKGEVRMNIIIKKTDDIKEYENNPRKNDDAVEYVANSIDEFGFRVPIVVDADGVIVCGHTRLKAAKSLGYEEVPCVVADELTEEQIRAFRLVDNKTQELAEWDWNIIFEELGSIENIDMTKMGFMDFLDEDKGELKERKINGGEEIDLESFADEEFKYVCPCCGFRFND